MKYLKAMMLTALLMVFGGKVFAQDKTFNLNETYPIANGGTLHLTSDDAEVTIQGTDRSDVHVVIYRHVEIDGIKVETNGTFDVAVEPRDSDLHITENSDEQNRVVVGRVKEKYQITIQAPRNIALNIEGDDDRYTIRNIDRAISLKADDTEAEILNTGGSQFDFSMDDGRIAMDKGQGTLQLSMDDGRFAVQKGTFSELQADIDDGTIDVTTQLAEDGSYQFDMDDGSLALNITTGGGAITVHHDDPNIHLDGNFEAIHTGEDRSEYRLPGCNAEIEIKTDDGEIELRVL